MARVIAEIARELPERSGEKTGELGEASIDEVVELFSRRLRSGILAVTAGSGQSARVVLRGDRPVTKAIEEFVERIQPLVGRAEGQAPLRWEFQETPTGKLRQLDLDEGEVEGEIDVPKIFSDRRLVLVERSPARADDLVQALRDRGAHVVVIDGEGGGLPKARLIDPDVIVVDMDGVGGWASGAIKQIRRDPRLRWASMLLTRSSELWPEGSPEPDVERLAAGLRPLVEPDEAITWRTLEAKAPFDLRMETTGPARMVRALARTKKTLHISVRHRRAIVELDVAEGLLVGATAKLEGGKQEVGGAAALAALLALGSGRVRVEQRDAPAVANVMSPIDDAIAAADRESPPLVPSLPPPSLPPGDEQADVAVPKPSRLPDSGVLSGNDPRDLVKQLEGLLDRLRVSIPPAALPESDTKVEIKAPPPEETKIPRAPGVPGMGIPRSRTLVGVPVPPAKPPAGASTVTKLPAPAARVPPPGAGSKVAKLPTAASAIRPPAPGEKKSATTTIKGHAVAAAAVPEPEPVAPLADDLEPSPEEIGGVHAIPASLAPEPTRPKVVPPEPRARAEQPSVTIGTPEPPRHVAVSPPTALLQASATPSAAPPPQSVYPASVYPAPPDPARRNTLLLVGAPIALSVLILVATIPAYLVWSAMSTPDAAAVALPPPVVPEPPQVATASPPVTVPADPAPVADPVAVAEPVPAPDPVAVAVADPVAAADPVAVADPVADPVAVAVADPAAGDPAPDPDPGLGDGAEEDEGSPADAELDPDAAPEVDRVRILIRRGNYRRTHGQLQAAESDYLRVLRMQPSSARAMAGLARLHMSRRDSRAAVHWARRLADARPTQPGNHVLLGDALQMAGDQAGARRAWQRALRVQPGYRDARRRLGE
jgi:hypothetical protein